jgi:hypothetical protein
VPARNSAAASAIVVLVIILFSSPTVLRCMGGFYQRRLRQSGITAPQARVTPGRFF